MHLVLVRHGESVWNAGRRVQGQADVPLSATGRRQAERVAAHIRQQHFDAAYASDLWRAWETADIVLREHALNPIADHRLHEANYGEWQGLSWDEIASQRAAEFSAWQADRNIAPPGGETLDEVAARVRAFLDEITTIHASNRVLIVGHGGPLRTLICLALKIPPALRWNLAMDNGSISELRLYPEGALLKTLNTTAHLREMSAAPPSKPADLGERVEAVSRQARDKVAEDRIARERERLSRRGATRPLGPFPDSERGSV